MEKSHCPWNHWGRLQKVQTFGFEKKVCTSDILSISFAKLQVENPANVTRARFLLHSWWDSAAVSKNKSKLLNIFLSFKKWFTTPVMKSERRRNSSEIVKFSGRRRRKFLLRQKVGSGCCRQLASRAYWGENLDCYQHLPLAFLAGFAGFPPDFSPICNGFLCKFSSNTCLPRAKVHSSI